MIYYTKMELKNLMKADLTKIFNKFINRPLRNNASINDIFKNFKGVKFETKDSLINRINLILKNNPTFTLDVDERAPVKNARQVLVAEVKALKPESWKYDFRKGNIEELRTLKNIFKKQNEERVMNEEIANLMNIEAEEGHSKVKVKFTVEEIKTAHHKIDSKVEMYTNMWLDLDDYLTESLNPRFKTLKRKIKEMKSVKLYERFTIEVMQKYTDPETGEKKEEFEIVYIALKTKVLLETDNIMNLLKAHNETARNKIEEHMFKGSGFVFNRVIKNEMNIFRYQPLRNGNYEELPSYLARKKCIINVKNNDQMCFKYAVLSAWNTPEKDPQRPSKYIDLMNLYNFDGLEFPLEVDKIHIFEKKNNCSINVFTCNEQGKDIQPIKIAKKVLEKHANLLVYKKHYMWIKDFSRLMGSTNSDQHKRFYCYHCLHGYTTEQLLKEHEALGCNDYEASKAILPKKDDAFIEFKNHHHKLKIPFVMYADFECFIKECDEYAGHGTRKVQKHEPSGYCLKVVSSYPDKIDEYPTEVYRGPDASKKFVERAVKIGNELWNKYLYRNEKMIISEQEEKEFQESNKCHICEKEIEDKKDKVRDHCHFTGKYRGSAHNLCNLNYNYKRMKIPVVFHNLKGYDSHLILNELGSVASQISCIAKNSEQYTSFNTTQLKFIDSLAFLQASLDKVSMSMVDEQFVETRKECKNEEEFRLLRKKGVYPYEYMNGFERFEETKLPEKECFYSKMEEQELSNSDYEHVKNIWRQFELKNLGELHDLYMKTDVNILTDVCESFRTFCMKTYKLDPFHYITLPSFGWDAMLKLTGVKLELFNEEQNDLYLLCEKGIRGGICYVPNKYANTQENPDEKMKKSIKYYDANNLYGYAMMQKLPVSGYKLNEDFLNLNEEEATTKIMNIDVEGEKGYTFVVDLEYPKELHDLHNDYPLAPESMIIEENILSDYQKKMMVKLGITKSKTPKLVPNLNDKERYIVHLKALKLYLSLGLKLKKIHQVLEFEQKAFLKPWIEINTMNRTKAKTDFEKDLFKLLNNSVFGKCMENVRDRVDVRLLGSAQDVNLSLQERYQKLINKPTFQSRTIFSDDLLAVQMKKTSVILNKPIAIGVAVLDISKYWMYNFHYNIIKPKFQDRVKLLMTDTDSLVYELKSEDINKEMKDIQYLFDYSDYPKDHPLYSVENKKKVGMFKDETNGIEITEFVGIRAKSYSFITEDPKKTCKKQKGIKKSFVKKSISHNDYRRCILADEEAEDTLKDLKQDAKFRTIRAFKHKIYTIEVSKTSLCNYDDKVWRSSSLTSLAHGHWRIKELEEQK